MKKIFSKKVLLIVFFIAIVVLIPIVIYAVGEQFFYRSNAFENNGKREVISKIGSSTIINRSDKDLFVPNKTSAEYDLWSKKAPNYVSVDVCGDGACSQSENMGNCPADCSIKVREYCGNGICQAIPPPDRSKDSYIRVYYGTGRTVTVPQRLCATKVNKWFYDSINKVLMFLSGTSLQASCGGTYTTTIYSELVSSLGETWANCPDDCSPPSDRGCGVCGYSSMTGNMCPKAIRRKSNPSA